MDWGGNGKNKNGVQIAKYRERGGLGRTKKKTYNGKRSFECKKTTFRDFGKSVIVVEKRGN